MKSEVLSETFLWNAFKLGDKSAFAEIYRCNYPALYSYGRKILPDASLVEDAIQELFVTLWRSRSNLAEVNNIKFYLFSCLRRNIYKENQKNEQVDLAGIYFLSALENQSHNEHTYTGEADDETMLVDKLKKLLISLPQRQCEAINLRYYENFSNQQIAVIMGISEKTVRNTLYKALLYLREQSHSLNMMLQIVLLYFVG